MTRRSLRPIRVPVPAQGLSAAGIIRPDPGVPGDLAEHLGKGLAAFAAGVHESMRQVQDVIAARAARVGLATMPNAHPGVVFVLDEAPELLDPHGRAALTKRWPAPTQPPAPAAAPVDPEPPVLPDGVRMIEPPQDWRPLPGERAVVLCGLIPGVDPWHDPAARQIAARYAHLHDTTVSPLAIICPRRRDVLRHPDGTTTVAGKPWTELAQARQVDWENRNIRPSHGVIMFWFPESTPEYVGPTSLYELGRAADLDVVVGADPGYARRDILDHQLPHLGLPLYSGLDDTITHTLRRLEQVHGAVATLPHPVRPVPSFFDHDPE